MIGYFLLIYLTAGGVKRGDMAHALKGQSAKGSAGVAESGQIPVAPVIEQPLGRNRAAVFFVFHPAVIAQVQPGSPDQGGGDGAEGCGTDHSDTDADELNPAGKFFG